MVGASLNLHLQYAEAEPILRDALAVATRVFGNDDVIVLDLARILAGPRVRFVHKGICPKPTLPLLLVVKGKNKRVAKTVIK